VVAQRWAKQGPNRYLITQKRGRWSFTKTLQEFKKWAVKDNHGESPFGKFVHKSLMEEKANGAAIIDTVKEEISGIKAINPRTSKEARARAITPEVESGHVYLPHPLDPGNEWVTDLLSELRNFPHDTNDDQVDGLTQALEEFREGGGGGISVPGRRPAPGIQGRSIPRNITAAAATMGRRIPGR
jgi:predicted phage terminase large subunit-like protein